MQNSVILCAGLTLSTASEQKRQKCCFGHEVEELGSKLTWLHTFGREDEASIVKALRQSKKKT